MNDRPKIDAARASEEISGGLDTVGIKPEEDKRAEQANDYLHKARDALQGYLGFAESLAVFNPAVKYAIYAFTNYVEDSIKNTTELSTRDVAKKMRKLSEDCWDKSGDNDITVPIQKECNNHLLTHAEDGTLNLIKSDQLTPLFKHGDEAHWPHLILTSNHARASETKDLHELMQGICRLAHDAWGRKLDICRLTTDTKPEEAATKNIAIMACHTEKDNLLNGANLIDRRLDLEEDKNIECPKDRTLDHISPAAVRLAKLMLKLMVEPESQANIDLGRSKADNDHPLNARPFVADDLQDKGLSSERVILRSDAKKIAGHIKLIGYSKGANTVTDALRFFYQECAHLGAQLKTRDKDGALRDATDADIKSIISGIALLNIAPGEVPLSKAEKEVLGINRTTILNDHDLTAGHLVNPNKDDYDDSQDKLIKIIGTKTESGHSVTDALGDDEKSGYIMDLDNGRIDTAHTKAAKKNAKNYQEAQKEIRNFFSSNHCYKLHPTSHVSGEKEIKSLVVGALNRA